VLGIVIGHFFPQIGVKLKPLGDIFVGLIKMMIAPVIFCTIVHRIASMSDLKSVGRVAIKALIYFEVVSTLALAIGLIVGGIVKPGHGFNINPATLDPKAVASYVTQAKEQGSVAHLLAIVPESFIGALAKGDILQVLLVSVLTGVTVAGMGSIGERITSAVSVAGKMFFRLIGIIVRAAPIGAFGAMAFTVGSYGLRSLINLGALIATFYATSLLFVLLVLGVIARLSGFSILRFIAYIAS
jgi:aerobic C4-dicarboxylate transport protein